ncbi:helix-turn-helix domain-containing protein [Burkholderia sp. Bp8963]|uniref:helix-turn-helix domain-containing protein n=1 Tax=Burkholderia sp. Bp8963 TaxID=2184547 RepID=UPI000F5A446A|nr:helix-turn-helix domain-containing protein [Burkholderia sp. Bp8963]RQS68477.1 helix-turn-helix domain-containing protein [Burkholderia sp. Bp8963]
MASGEVFLSTDQVEPALRDEYWRDVTRPIAETTPVADRGDARLAGTLVSRMFGEMLLWRASVNAQQYRRDRRTIEQSGLDHYIVQFVHSGAHVGNFNGIDARAATGDIYLIDLGQPLSSRVDAGASFAVVVPRDRLELAADGRNLHGAVLSASRGITRLLADYLMDMHRVAAHVSAPQAIAVQDAMVTLLAAALLDAPHADGKRFATHGAALRRRIVQHISHHLTDHDLGPESLIAHFRISRAHLYRVFEADGGVARFIRDRRLDLAYRALVDPRSNGQSIKEVALRHGFSSSDRFVHAMRQRFGMTAREVRMGQAKRTAAAHDLSRLHGHFARHAVPPKPTQDTRGR